MWKDDAAKLKSWLSETPNCSSGAKDFLRVRMGLRPALPWTPGHAFGLSVDEPEMNGGPVSGGEGAANASGDAIQTQN